jgi:hypothetical protein
MLDWNGLALRRLLGGRAGDALRIAEGEGTPLEIERVAFLRDRRRPFAGAFRARLRLRPAPPGLCGVGHAWDLGRGVITRSTRMPTGSSQAAGESYMDKNTLFRTQKELIMNNST